MVCECSALWIHNPRQPVEGLKELLSRSCGRVQEAQTCKEAESMLAGSQPPHVVFADARQLDGDWREILRLAENAREPVNVIVISPQMDQKLYLDALQRGAYDFVAEPIAPADLEFIVQSAAGNACHRRMDHAHAA